MDELELELRRIPGVLAVAIDTRMASPLVRVVAVAGADLASVAQQAGDVVRMWADVATVEVASVLDPAPPSEI